MKTSNKILLTVLILVLITFTAVQLTLSSKYKNGQYTTVNVNAGRDSVTIKPVRFIKLKGLDNVVIVPSYAYRLEIQKEMPSYFRYTVVGDTLIVTGDTSFPNERRRTYEEVSIHVPQMKLIQAENCTVNVTGKLDSVETGLMRFELIQSRMFFTNHYNQKNAQQYFGEVFIKAKQNSEIDFGASTISFKTFACELESSTLRDNQFGKVDKFMVKASDSSSLQLTGSSLQRLNIVPKSERFLDTLTIP
ncbi:MAG: hypothetical protein EOO02_03790 [Chitinophagaceae bacterium]|nr:MAG: hypothetical protein EOO02_03790 [Chitinophagaceae bacterium]